MTRDFGTFEGDKVVATTIRSDAGAKAEILTWGAVLRDLIVPSAGGPQRVTLGLNTLEDYVAHSPSFGCVPGRYANRIANAAFSLDGKSHHLDVKPGQKHTLHGGLHGFGHRVWTVEGGDARSLKLRLISRDGEAGFPGRVDATCLYRFLEPATLRIELRAVCDAPTVVNLTHHAYFNLDGGVDILDHKVRLNCGYFTPVDAELIPTGEICAVSGSAYDFVAERAIRNSAGVKYDTNFVVTAPQDMHGLAEVAVVRPPRGGPVLTVRSTAPGVQFYDAGGLNCPVPGLNGARYGAHAGFCLEPQFFPDSPNRRQFPSSVLRPGETYAHDIEFAFS